MNELEALVLLNMVPEMGSARLGKLLECFARPQDIITASAEKLTQVSGIGARICAKIRALRKIDLDKELSLAKSLGLEIFTRAHPDYPENLKNIPGAPIILYVWGKFKPEDKFSIAIVGSRRASFYGLNHAQKFAADLSETGFSIVSGLARGVDTYAHRGALKMGGRTIAVIGSGLNNIYPPENKELAQGVAQSGAVVSEFPLNALPKKENFPRRNRVISGLSLGTLVIEAAKNSGALITADFALEQGREVFALPGKVDAGNSFGANELIKQGAKLVTCAQEITEEFILFEKIHALRPRPRPALRSGAAMTQEESGVYSLISGDSILLDELAEKTNIDIPRISGILLKLQIKKLIRELPGKQFVRS